MFVGRGKQIVGNARVKEKWDLLKLITVNIGQNQLHYS